MTIGVLSYPSGRTNMHSSVACAGQAHSQAAACECLIYSCVRKLQRSRGTCPIKSAHSPSNTRLSPQTASRSIQPFLHSSPVCPRHRHSRPRYVRYLQLCTRRALNKMLVYCIVFVCLAPRKSFDILALYKSDYYYYYYYADSPAAFVSAMCQTVNDRSTRLRQHD